MISLLEDLHPAVSALGLSSISIGLTSIKKFKPNELPQSGFTVDYDANPKRYESFELYVNAVERGEDLELHCHYDVKLFENLTIREWLATLDCIFQDVAAEPSREVLDLARLKRSDASSVPGRVFREASSRNVGIEFLPSFRPRGLERRPQSSDSRAGGTMTESALLRALLPLWRRVLDVRNVGPDDDFFALGWPFHCCGALVCSDRTGIGCIVPLASLYDASTPRMLVGVLSRGKREGIGTRW